RAATRARRRMSCWCRTGPTVSPRVGRPRVIPPGSPYRAAFLPRNSSGRACQQRPEPVSDPAEGDELAPLPFPEGVAAAAGQEDGPVAGQRGGGEVLGAGVAAGDQRGGGHTEGQRLEVVGAGGVAGGGR